MSKARAMGTRKNINTSRPATASRPMSSMFMFVLGGNRFCAQPHLQHHHQQGQKHPHPCRRHEPDLGDCLTSVVFLVDDRVFDRVTWPEYDGLTYDDGTPDPTEYWEWKMKFSESEIEADKIVWLRDWLPKFRLA